MEIQSDLDHHISLFMEGLDEQGLPLTSGPAAIDCMLRLIRRIREVEGDEAAERKADFLWLTIETYFSGRPYTGDRIEP